MKKNLVSIAVAVCVVSMASMAWAGATKITSLPYTINNSGSYRVDGNLSSNGHGIILNVDHVTIDLQGYVISGDGEGEDNGIWINTHSNVLVKNGTIINFFNGAKAVSASATVGHSNRFVNVSLIDNIRYGLDLHGYNNLVKDCVLSGNGLDAMHLGDGGIISGNLVYNNSGDSVEAHDGMVVTGNSVVGNAGDGIDVGDGSAIIGNTVYQNGTGIEVRDGSTVQNNAVSQNQLDGIKAYQTGTFTASGNASVANDMVGEGHVNMSECTNCVLGTNVAPAPVIP